MDFIPNFNAYDVFNGLCGLKRDILLCICEMFWYKTDLIRKVIGLCKDHYPWKKHLYFRKSRPMGLPVSFYDLSTSIFTSGSLDSRFKLVRSSIGQRGTFTSEGLLTVFLNKSLTQGIFHWNLRINYSSERQSRLWIGAQNAEELHVGSSFYLGIKKDSCSFGFWKHGDMLYSDIFGVEKKDMSASAAIPSTENPVPDGCRVAIELDMNAHTASFFLEETKIPHVVSNVCTTMSLGVSGFNRPSFTSLSLCRQIVCTPSRVLCTPHKMIRYYPY